LRATIALCFLVGELFSLAILIVEKRLGLVQFSDALLLALPLAVGLLGSGWLHGKISSARLRDALLIFAVVSGLLLILQSAMA
jgi:hypothetical protein